MASTRTSENGVVGAVHLTRNEIAARVTELGIEIAEAYEGLDPILIAPLKSSVVFLADLTRALRIPHTLDVIELAPYTGGQDGAVRLIKDVDVPLEGRHVLLVEDVVDTGLTLNYLLKTLRFRGAASVEVCTLLDRPYRRLTGTQPRYIGFTATDDFVVGYGFDFRQRYRNLPDIHILAR